MSGGRVTWVDRFGAGDAEAGGPAGGAYWVLADGAAPDVGAPGIGLSVSLGVAGGFDVAELAELGDAECGGDDAGELEVLCVVEPRCPVLSR